MIEGNRTFLKVEYSFGVLTILLVFVNHQYSSDSKDATSSSSFLLIRRPFTLWDSFSDEI